MPENVRKVDEMLYCLATVDYHQDTDVTNIYQIDEIKNALFLLAIIRSQNFNTFPILFNTILIQ